MTELLPAGRFAGGFVHSGPCSRTNSITFPPTLTALVIFTGWGSLYRSSSRFLPSGRALIVFLEGACGFRDRMPFRPEESGRFGTLGDGADHHFHGLVLEAYRAAALQRSGLATEIYDG